MECGEIVIIMYVYNCERACVSAKCVHVPMACIVQSTCLHGGMNRITIATKL